MTQTQNIFNDFRSAKCFINTSDKTLQFLSTEAKYVSLKQGQTLLRAGVIETHGFLLLDGSLRLLASDPFQTSNLYTVGALNKGELIGVIDLLRQAPCEAAIARRPSTLLSFPLKTLLNLYLEDVGLKRDLDANTNPCEAAGVLAKAIQEVNPAPKNGQQWILERLFNNEDKTIDSSTVKLLSTSIRDEEDWIGRELPFSKIEELKKKTKLSLRFIEVTKEDFLSTKTDAISSINKESEQPHKTDKLSWVPTDQLDLASIGLKDAKSQSDLQGFKVLKGRGSVGMHLAALKMIARAYETPCPVDVLEKILEGTIERTGSVPIQTMGQLLEAMGLQTQLGELDLSQLHRLELPVIVRWKNHYSLISEVNNKQLLLADPEKGWIKLSMVKAEEKWGSSVQVVLIKRLSDTPKRQFGWSWFAPVLKRFSWPLVQVLLASLFIQLFQLANPLLLQQIIDKVINQSNLSALQVLGGALVAAALFQGLLTAVRTWLLVDTTDRMDLLLGSQVIDKLLRLPLRYFEARPVGELSQRLGGLASIRSFLTGTAITSALDLLFAVIYILIMLIYSPLLTAVALGTVPLYILLILFIAPLYRRLIRRQAEFSAKTQSHLIESLSGIQTIKAQHFELNSRWRWQERYSGQIAEGFKSLLLGSSAGEIGNFLNQLSSLLIIWVGVYQVVNGDLSLGQLIAFRIIAGYVTGPILRLSGLWQQFQQVGISMERLGDIVDQTPESGEDESGQISLPPIKGNIVFDSLEFRFGKSGPYQINNVNLSIPAGMFIGIVGQSGSGKSTLMKLLPRLYSPEKGRILIDDYDISKVNLNSLRQQIGIVPQDCLLFEGTIRDNISMNQPEADTETITRVAKAAEAHDFIMELSNGYATRLGERGAGLSGGQRQRIAIARTLLQNPNLLVLDEATSALDYDTESRVCRNLQMALDGKTVFFITHRLSTVKRADLIVLMHQGKVVEQGTHDELIEENGRYAALYSHQGDE